MEIKAVAAACEDFQTEMLHPANCHGMCLNGEMIMNY